jgi:hypothetical protein
MFYGFDFRILIFVLKKNSNDEKCFDNHWINFLKINFASCGQSTYLNILREKINSRILLRNESLT